MPSNELDEMELAFRNAKRFTLSVLESAKAMGLHIDAETIERAASACNDAMLDVLEAEFKKQLEMN